MPKILIVEDESVMSSIQQEALSRASLECDIARDGIEALKFLRKHAYAAVVMDIIMPHMDGFGLLKKIRENPQWNDLPIIVLSNLSQDADKQECLKMGCCSYLLKTETSLDAMVEEIKKQVDMARFMKDEP